MATNMATDSFCDQPFLRFATALKQNSGVSLITFPHLMDFFMATTTHTPVFSVHTCITAVTVASHGRFGCEGLILDITSSRCQFYPRLVASFSFKKKKKEK